MTSQRQPGGIHREKENGPNTSVRITVSVSEYKVSAFATGLRTRVVTRQQRRLAISEYSGRSPRANGTAAHPCQQCDFRFDLFFSFSFRLRFPVIFSF